MFLECRYSRKSLQSLVRVFQVSILPELPLCAGIQELLGNYPVFPGGERRGGLPRADSGGGGRWLGGG